MNSKVIQRLIWKDRRSLMPLFIAVVLGVICFNIMVVVIANMHQMRLADQLSFATAVAVLLPVLFAYGAPAILVGGEEESGSLAWLKTLPVSWRAIVSSKLLIAVGSLIGVLALSTICLAIQYQIVQSDPQFTGRGPAGDTNHVIMTVILTWPFTVMLLLISFIAAYLFRSPITALLMVVPMSIALFFGFVYTVGFFAGRFQLSTSTQNESQVSVLAIGIGFALLAMLYVLHQLAARWRLTRPELEPGRSLIQKVAKPNAYQPPEYYTQSWYGVSLSQERATPFGAMMWQNVRQSGVWLIALTLVGCLAALLSSVAHRNFEELTIFIACWCLFMIASMTFYGDSVRGRCRFFFDRGISPSLVWLTRILGTLIPTLMIVSVGCVAVVLRMKTGQMNEFGTLAWDIGSAVSAVIFGYAITQLVSQWAPRPTLGFFAAPVFVTLAAFALGILLAFYTNAFPILLLSSAVLLWASWYLTPAWMNGREMEKKHGYNIVFTTALAVSFLLPWVLILGTRYVTMPSERTEWKAQMLAASAAKPTSTEAIEILDSSVAGTLALVESASMSEEDDIGSLLQAELDEDHVVGSHVSIRNLVRVLATNEDGYVDPKSFVEQMAYENVPGLLLTDKGSNHYLAIKVLTQWSNEVRQAMVNRQASYRTLFGVAENADWLVAGLLVASLNEHGRSPELDQLIQSLPSLDVVRESRRVGVQSSYRRFSELDWDFLGSYLSNRHAPWQAIEKMRSKRYVDEVAYEVTNQINLGGNLDAPQLVSRIRTLEKQASLVAHYGYSGFSSLPPLTEQFEKMAQTDRWRARLDR